MRVAGSIAADKTSPGGVDTLVEAAQGGDRRAYEQLVARYQRFVCSLGFAWTGDMSLAEELAQDVFVIAWRHLGELRDSNNFSGWLFMIARNRIWRAQRGRKRKPAEPMAPATMSEMPSAEPSPLDQIISREEARVVWNALARIPESYRVPLVLIYREHQSVEQVAEALGLNIKTVWQRLSRGRAMLQHEVTEFVTGALAKVRPREDFTMVVMEATAKLPQSPRVRLQSG